MVAEVEAGARIGEKFVVERVIGSGGMGVVVAARHAELGQRVAIKLLKEGVLADADTEQRFFREARALARLQSDHVVRVHDVGRREDGTPFMVMEYLEGDDLSAVLRARNSVPFEEVVRWILEACTGLAEAHARGLVHRDLKPGNLFLAKRLDGSARVKVLDFGIAKSTRSRSKLTGARVFLGSPRYMSPEQLHSSRTVDARADIWSLGCVMYRLLSGKPPFDGEDLEEILGKIPLGQREDLRVAAPDLPEALYAAVDRCLEPDRDRRFGSVVELSQALAPIAGGGAQELVESIANITARPMTTGTAIQEATQPMPAAPSVPEVKPGEPTRALGPVVDGSADTEPAKPERVSLEPTVDDPALAAKSISNWPAPGSTPSPAVVTQRSDPPPGSAPPSHVAPAAPGWRRGVVVLALLVAIAVLVVLFLRFGAATN
jgi:serine/threonine-protein kinase